MGIWTRLDNWALPVAVTSSRAPAPAGAAVCGCPVVLLLLRGGQSGTPLRRPVPTRSGPAGSVAVPGDLGGAGAGGCPLLSSPTRPLVPSVVCSCFKVTPKRADQPCGCWAVTRRS